MELPSPDEPGLDAFGLDALGLPPTDASGDIDVAQIEWNLRLSPAERLRPIAAAREFAEAARTARIRRYGFDPADSRSPE